MILEFNISHQNIKRIDNNYLVNLSKNYLKCRFNFLTDDWEGLDRYVSFNVKGRNYRYDVTDGGLFDLPNEIHNHKYFYIQAYGMDNELNRILTTNSIVISLNNQIIKPLFIKDEKIEDMINILGGIINKKVDGFHIDGNKLICYYGETPLQIIPINNNQFLDFLTEDYIEIDTRKLNSNGMLFYERYKL